MKRADLDKIQPISPRDRMPVPYMYFFICIADNSGMSLFPAILKQYTSPENFYSECIAFDKDGIAKPVLTQGIGWIEMFQKTKTYRIEINN